MDKKQLYESIMRQVSIEVKKALNEQYINEENGADIKRRHLAYVRLRNILNEFLCSGDEILDEHLIDVVNYDNSDSIDDYVEDITIRRFIESIYEKHPVEIANAYALDEVMETMCKIINDIIPNPYTPTDLKDAYYYGL